MLSQEKIESAMLKSAKDTFEKNLSCSNEMLTEERAKRAQIEADLEKSVQQLNKLQEANAELEEKLNNQVEINDQHSKYILRFEREFGKNYLDCTSTSTQTVTTLMSMETQTDEPFVDRQIVLSLHGELDKTKRELDSYKTGKNQSMDTKIHKKVVKKDPGAGLLNTANNSRNLEVIEISDDDEEGEIHEAEKSSKTHPAIKRYHDTVSGSRAAVLTKKSKRTS